jgi:hypothetical protein
LLNPEKSLKEIAMKSVRLLTVALAVLAMAGCGRHDDSDSVGKDRGAARTPAAAAAPLSSAARGTTGTAAFVTTARPLELPRLPSADIARRVKDLSATVDNALSDTAVLISPEEIKRIRGGLSEVSQAFKGRVEDKGSDWWMEFSEARQELVTALDRLERSPSRDEATSAAERMRAAVRRMEEIVELFPD